MTSLEHNSNREISPRKEALVDAVISGLKATYFLHEKLGDAGTTEHQLNEFGEMALVMDILSEEEIISSLKETHISMQVVSEEHGEFSIGDKPEYMVILDGLDGSNEYKSRRGKAMYGAMVGILEGVDPAYDDYLVCGIMIHSPTPHMFLAIKDQGCFLVNVATGEKKLIQTENKELSDQSPIDIDTNWPPYEEVFNTNKKDFPNMDCRNRSAAARIAMFLNGDIEIGLEWSRKKNLEQAVVYGLVREAGGVHVTADGLGIGIQDFKSFAQNKIPLIIASNRSLAMQVSERFDLRRLDSRKQK